MKCASESNEAGKCRIRRHRIVVLVVVLELTSKAVCDPDLSRCNLSQQHAHHTFPRALCGPAIVIACGEEDKGSDGDYRRGLSGP